MICVVFRTGTFPDMVVETNEYIVDCNFAVGSLTLLGEMT